MTDRSLTGKKSLSFHLSHTPVHTPSTPRNPNRLDRLRPDVTKAHRKPYSPTSLGDPPKNFLSFRQDRFHLPFTRVFLSDVILTRLKNKSGFGPVTQTYLHTVFVWSLTGVLFRVCLSSSGGQLPYVGLSHWKHGSRLKRL